MNIIACSIDRLPRFWRIFRQDNLAMKRGRLEKMQQHLGYFRDKETRGVGG